MNEKKRLDALLEELYAIDPSLRAQGESLRPLAAELLASRPDAPIDERFIARLRKEILARKPAVSSHTSFMSFLSGKNARFLVPGLAALVLVVVGTIALQAPKSAPSSTPSAGVRIARVEPGAFGTLESAQLQAGAPSAAADLGARDSASPEAVAPSAPMPASLPPMAGGGMGVPSSVTADGKMIAPGEWIPTYYSYRYTGEAIENLAAQVDVYRRVKGASGAGPVDALQTLNLGLIDLGKARDGFVQNFTIAEKRDQGYVFNVDPQEGMISVYQNTKWISPLARCMSQECYDQNRLKESDMPSDEAAIQAADAFLAEYGISKAGYGAPAVNAQWRVQYLAMAASIHPDFWFPDAVTVIYPTLVDGKIAYDEGGSSFGLNVNVDVRAKRVSSVWNLATRDYQVSSYAAETDAKRLIGLAENTDDYYGGTLPESAKKIEIELGTPTVAYVRAWQQQGDIGAELLVPALVFPIKNAPADYWRQNVILPLAKELLDARNIGGRPMPLDTPVMVTPPPAIKDIK